MQVYLVGGAVRDKLLKVTRKDKDYVVVGSNEQEMLHKGFSKVGKDFPVFLHPATKEEYALARIERKTKPGYNGFSCITENVSLRDDLSRRDLTINAMAMTEDGEVVDFFSGQQDLHNKVLRHVSSAFAEDPLRVLRVARFLARFGKEFTVADETKQIMREIVASGELQHLTAERIFIELQKALMEDSPQLFFMLLEEVGALNIILPEVSNLRGIPQTATHHPEVDTFKHIMLAVGLSAKLGASFAVRYTVLLHDLGKGLTKPEILPSHHGHDIAGVKPVRQVNRRLKASKECAELAELTTRYHILCHTMPNLKPGTILKTIYALDGFRREDRFKQFLLACEIDARGRLGRQDSQYPQAAMWQQILTEIKQIKPSLTDNELTGEEIKEQLNQARTSKIKQMLLAFK